MTCRISKTARMDYKEKVMNEALLEFTNLRSHFEIGCIISLAYIREIT